MPEYRLACHAHSEWSYDAKWPLERIAAEFRRRGFDGILMSEHDRGFDEERWVRFQEDCERASRDGFAVLPGIEYSDPSNVVHLPTWGEIPFLGESRATEELLAEAAGGGAAVVFAHPSRKDAWQRFDPAWLEHLVAIELWNRKSDGYAPSPHAVDLVARHGARFTVGQDFHTPRQFFPLAVTLELPGALELPAAVDALRSGRFRASAFGKPVEGFTGGALGGLVRGAERARRPVARWLRKLR